MKYIVKYVFPLILFIGLNMLAREVLFDVTPFLTSGLFLYYLFLDNEDTNYLKQFAISIFLLPILQGFLSSGLISTTFGMPLVYLVSGATMVFYILRFWKKANRYSLFEIMKVVAVLAFVSAYSIDISQFSAVATFLLVYIYFITRVFQTQNVPPMIKNIFVSLLVLVTFFFIVYAQLQKGYAEDALMDSEQRLNTMLADENERLSVLESKIDLLETKLLECQSGK